MVMIASPRTLALPASCLASMMALTMGGAVYAQPAAPTTSLQQLTAAEPVSGGPGNGGAVSTDHPRLSPEKDVKVVYRFRAGPQGQAPMKQVTVWFAADGDELRIEPEGVKAVTLLDRPAQRVTLMSLQEKSYIQFLPLHGLRNPFMLDLNMHYTREGITRVAGQPCRNWAITTPRGKAEACVTEDGVILAEKGVDADGVTGELQAVQVVYGPIPASTFQPPADFRHIQPHARPGQLPAAGTQAAAPVQNAPIPGAPTSAPAGLGAGGAPLPGQVLQDTSQPHVPNDSAGDGTTQHADQPR